MKEEAKKPGKTKLSYRYKCYTVSRNHVNVSKQSTTKHVNQLNAVAPIDGSNKAINQKDKGPSERLQSSRIMN